MPRVHFSLALYSLLLVGSAAACDGDDISDRGPSSIEDFFPEVSDVTGEAQSVFAGQISDVNAQELIPGPASSGVLGDYFMRNNKARFVIQDAVPAISVVPSGGSLVDAVPLAADGSDASPDHFGETSIFYQMGRDCSHDLIEVVRDGSEGGAAIVRARGVTAYNKYVNIRGFGVLPVQQALLPERADAAECATTYVLEPDSLTMQMYFTIFNPSDELISGPMGMLSDTGGEVFVFLPGSGFTRLGDISEAVEASNLNTPYMVWQGPDVAYGVIPRHSDATATNGSVALLGISVFIFGVEGFLDAFQSTLNKFFAIEPSQGFTFGVDIFVGRDAADVDAAFRAQHGIDTEILSGQVTWDDGSPAADARVAVFEDRNDNGLIDDNDSIVSYANCGPAGNYEASLVPGEYLLRAEVPRLSRSQVANVSTLSAPVATDFSLVQPVSYDYRIVDDGDAMEGLIPARITVIGNEPVPQDVRTEGDFDQLPGVVTTVTAIRGTSNVGDNADAPILLPPGEDYRILVSRGTEWSVAELAVSPTVGEDPAELEFRLRRVIDTPGYLASEYHVHSIGSPDSPISNTRRVMTAVADGIEFYATTDHDYVTLQQPVIESLGLERLTRSIPGQEISPLVYGHFNVWPIEQDDTSPNGGAVDWPFGTYDFAMTPTQIFAAAVEKGAELIQVNHPRKGPNGSSDLTEHFDRVGLYFDYENRTYQGDVDMMPVPAEWLRLPEETDLFSSDFNSLEVWNGFSSSDTDGDGVREITKLDIVMRDWFNFLSFGKDLTPIGSSDTHDVVVEQMGMPRTMVRVTDDSADAIESGTALTREVLDNLARTSGALTDVVVTDGPHITMSVDGDTSPLGKVIDGTGGSISITIDIQSPDWAHYDTVEFFANSTPEVGDVDVSALQPFACFTTRTSLDVIDPCALAGLVGGGASSLTVDVADLGGGFERFESTKTFSVTPADITSRTGASGQDVWIVARVRGDRAIYPLYVGNLLVGQEVSTFVNGPSPALELLLEGRGRPAAAFTAPFFVDFDGGGYKAPFAP
jgi:hypothetical protein